ESAGTAEEGLEKARRLKPDAVMLDLMLPGRTGWGVLEDLRADPGTASIPVFVTSVLDFDRNAIARGAADYLQKPLTREALVRALREHMPERFANI
ncbi:MAG TPA: response regulator, partial [Bryobacteraceae bacterium]|nr:response regulator [Bryobacteraceae bacterium]